MTTTTMTTTTMTTIITFFRPTAVASALLVTAFAGLGSACIEEDTSLIDEDEIVNQIIERYADQGELVFVSPQDPETGEVITDADPEAFGFVSPEAEAAFVADLEAAGISNEPDEQFRSDASDWFCSGSTTVNTAGSLATWTFETYNGNTRRTYKTEVDGTAFHPGGNTLSCKKHNSGVDSSRTAKCNLWIPLAAGYNSGSGKHYCCERRSWGKTKCTNTFGTYDTL